MSEKRLRVLSVQSHVVSGYCGGKSAIFPLQTLGFDVDFINSVQFSNHGGYETKLAGQVLNDEDLWALYNGLKANGLHRNYSHLLTGYTRSVSFLEALHSIIKEIKDISPDTVYLCDPVLGDNGRLYALPEMVSIYREKLLKIADIICPNQFEAEILTDIKIVDLKSAISAIDRLHQYGIKTVIITSTESNLDLDSSARESGDNLMVLGSSFQDLSKRRQLYRLCIPRQSGMFAGPGDLFSALFLAWFTKTNYKLKQSLENVVATMQAIIGRTCRYAKTIAEDFGEDRNSQFAKYELQIVQGRTDIIKPDVKLFAQSIDLQ